MKVDSSAGGSPAVDAGDSEASAPEAGGVVLTAAHCPGGKAGPAVGSELFVAASGTDGRIASTLDGEVWQDVTTSSKGPTTPGHTRNLIRGVGYGGGIFVAVGGYDNAYISTTCDGVNFRQDVLGTNTDAAPSPPYDNFLEEVTFADGALIAVGGAGLRLRSTDYSLTWQSTGSYYDGHLRGVVTGNGRVVAVGHDWGGGNGIWTTSTDAGASWAPMQSAPGELYDIAYGNGVFVAVGPDHCVTSADGSAWSPCDASAGSAFRDVRFIAGKWYLQRLDGSYVSSADATVWSGSSPGFLPLATARGTSRFVMVNVQTRGYSTDFVNWKEFPYPGLENLTVGTVTYTP